MFPWKVCWPVSAVRQEPGGTRPDAGRGLPARDVLAALERAVRYGAFSLQAIATHPGGAGPAQDAAGSLADDHRTYLDRLLDGEPTPPRPTSDYQALLGEGPRRCRTNRPRHTERATPRDRRARTTAATSASMVTSTKALRTLGVAVTPEALDAAL